MTAFQQRWMIVWAWLCIGFGAMFALAAVPRLSGPALLFLDVVFWPLDGRPAAIGPEAAFATGIAGALTVTLGVIVLGLARDADLSRRPAVWRAVTTGLVAWFIVDSLASYVTGAGMNVLGNVGFLAGYLVPVVQSGMLTAAPAEGT